MRNYNPLTCKNPRTEKFGKDTIEYLGLKIWDIVPDRIKKSSSLKIFKENIAKWVPSKCPCKLCKTYIPGVGFIWNNF